MRPEFTIKALAEHIEVPFPLSSENERQVERLWQALDHIYECGKAGMYPDGDFSSHAELVYGDLATLQSVADRLAPCLECEAYVIEEAFFDLYLAQHSNGLNDGGHLAEE